MATHKGLAYWPFKIRAVQGHSEKAVQKAAASDTFNATLVYAGGGTVALSKVSLTGKPLATAEETPGVIYHRTTGETGKEFWKKVLSPVAVTEFQAAERTTIFLTRKWTKRVLCPVFALKERLKFVLPRVKLSLQVWSSFERQAMESSPKMWFHPSAVSIEVTDNKTNLYVRRDTTEQAARSTGAATSVKQHIATFEGRANPRAQTGKVASPSKDVPVIFPGKFKPPPPIALPKAPGYADSRMSPTPPPKADAPKTSPRTDAQKAKSPRPPTSPKAESPRPALPKAKAQSQQPVAKATTEEPNLCQSPNLQRHHLQQSSWRPAQKFLKRRQAPQQQQTQQHQNHMAPAAHQNHLVKQQPQNSSQHQSVEPLLQL